jgi:BirA family biotin operon repressor/biotin-[acetyl-CoA-carboxylase] ligase
VSAPDPDRYLARLREAAPAPRTLHYSLARLEVREAVGSTNAEAAALAAAGAPHGTLVVADGQTAGRGRLGRAWESPPGVGVWASWILRPTLPGAEAPRLTLLASVATAEAIRGWAGAAALLKWPNDVEVAGRKVAGVLAELATEGAGIRHVVLGIGINVNQVEADFPPALAGRATSVRLAVGGPVDRFLLLRGACARLASWLAAEAEHGWRPVLRRWGELDGAAGRLVRVEVDGRAEAGRAAGIDRTGALQVRREDGETIRVGAGEVTWLAAEAA